MDDRLKISLGDIQPEDDFRATYTNDYSEKENKSLLDELMSAGEPAATPETLPAGAIPQTLKNSEAMPVADAPADQEDPLASEDEGQAAPWWSGAGEPDPASAFLAENMEGVSGTAGAVVKDVVRGVSEAVPQAYGGVIDAIGEVDQFMQSVLPIGGMKLWDEEGNFDPTLISNEEMRALEKADKTLFDAVTSKDADSVTGGFIRSGFQFLTGFVPGFQVARGAKMGTLAASMTAGAVADMVTFDPHEARLSTFLNEVPALQSIVPDYLAAHGEDVESEFEGRIKNAIEGAGIGILSEGLLRAFKYYKAQRNLVPEIDANNPAAIAQRDEAQALAKAEIESNVSDEMFANLGDASPDAPLLVVARPDDTLKMSLERQAAAEQRTALNLEREDALAKIKEITDKKKRPESETGVASSSDGSITREAIDDALDELRSGSVSKARLPARPVASIVRGLGGIDPSSSFAGDLRSRGITSRSFPGLYKRGGYQTLDNIPASEHTLFMERGLVDGNGYIDQQAFIDGLEAELKGDPWRTAEETKIYDEIMAPSQELDEQLSRLGVDYENMSNDQVKQRLKEIVDEEQAYLDHEQSILSRQSPDEPTRSLAELEAEQREIWSVEEIEQARARGVDEATITAHSPNKVYINMARIKSADDVKGIIQQMADMDKAAIDKKTGGRISNEQTLKESDKEYQDINDLVGRAPGPMSRTEAVAARKILVSSAEQVQQLAIIASKPNAGKADLYNFRRAVSVHSAIQAEVIGARAETARALQSWSIPVGTDKQRTQVVSDFINEYRGGDLEKLAKSIATADGDVAINTMTRQAMSLKVADAMYSIYINGLLSGPKTHLVNSISNVAVALYSIPERYLAEGFSNAFGRGDVARGEASAMAYGMLQGVRDGFRLMVKGSKAEGMDGLGHLWDQFGKADIRPDPISGSSFGLDANSPMYKGLDVVGRLISVPGTALDRADLFFKSVNYRMEMHALAFREASLEGLEGKDFGARMAETLTNPPAHLIEEANRMALVNTFTHPLGETGRSIQKMIANTPMRWAIPFVRTPTNILKYTFARTPLAYASSAIRADIAAGGARAAQAQARIGLGTMMMMTFGGLAADGVVSGGGSLDREINSARMSGGWQPYSVKIGDKWYSYSRLDPLGMMLGLAADLQDIGNSMGDAEADADVFAAVSTALVQNLASKTYMQGAFELAAALDPRNPTSDPAKFMTGVAGGLVPYSALLRQTAQALDPTIRETKDRSIDEFGDVDQTASFLNNLINQYKRGIPGLSDTLPPVRDIFGEPIRRVSGNGAAYDMLVPIQASTDKNDPVVNAIVDNNVKIRRPSDVVNGVKLTADQYDELQLMAGEMVRERLDAIVSSPAFSRLSDGEEGMKAMLIKKTVQDAHASARERLLATTPDIREKYRAREIRKSNKLLGR